MAPPDGADGVRKAWESAQPWEPDPEDDSALGGGPGEFDAEGDGPEIPPEIPSAGLPDDCPVIPLGQHGKIYYFLDRLKQLQDVPVKDLQRSLIVAMFQPGARDYLRRVWPRKSQDKNTGEWVVTGWAPEEAQFDLSEACARRGVWSPRGRVRGAGAWKDIDGALILHCGDRVFKFAAAGGKPKDTEPGLVGEQVYPAAPPTPRPHDDAQTAERRGGPGWQLLSILKTWNWARPTIDPVLLLGWICAGQIGGALKFRPMIWIPGEFGTGKSSLQDLIKWLYGTTGLLSVANASAAGIQQTLGYSSLPAALDEQEASADGRKVTGIIELAREASTGAVRVRGGSDQNAHSFNIQSAFVFSSILMPSMEPQDVSRFAVLDLRELPKGAKPPEITERQMNELGRQLLRRMVDGWERFAETLAAYRGALMGSGKHSGRGADLFGTLLACAHLALNDALPSEEILGKWAALLDATKLAELDGASSDKDSCLNFLLTKTITDQHNRRERSIAEWVERAHGLGEGVGEQERLHASQILCLKGLKWYPKDGYHYLAVSNNHQGVAEIFRDTKWAATPGNPGVWRQSLSRLPGAIVGHQVKFPPNNRAVLVPLALFLPDVPAPPGAKDSSAAGSEPGTASAAAQPSAEARDRSAADTAQSTASAPTRPAEDPFDLTSYDQP
jgi:hypothetical protein